MLHGGLLSVVSFTYAHWWATVLGRLRRRKTVTRTTPSPARYAVLLPPESRQRVFAKVYTQNAPLEFARGQALFDAAQRTGHFLAPRPLALVESHQLILWEYQDGLVESRDFLISSVRGSSSDAPARRTFFSRVGRALAGIHTALGALDSFGPYQPFTTVRSPFPELNRRVAAVLAETPVVAPHWDFACGNLFVHAGGPAESPVWVLDPMPNFYIMPEYFKDPGFGSNRLSSPYVDAAQLIFSLRSHPRFSGWVTKEQDGYVDAFLSGYREAGGAPLDRAVALACAGELTLMYQDLLDRSGRNNSLSSWLDRRFRLWSANQLFRDAAARLTK